MLTSLSVAFMRLVYYGRLVEEQWSVTLLATLIFRFTERVDFHHLVETMLQSDHPRLKTTISAACVLVVHKLGHGTRDCFRAAGAGLRLN